jgi:hypothetical protein
MRFQSVLDRFPLFFPLFTIWLLFKPHRNSKCNYTRRINFEVTAIADFSVDFPFREKVFQLEHLREFTSRSLWNTRAALNSHPMPLGALPCTPPDRLPVLCYPEDVCPRATPNGCTTGKLGSPR